MKRALFVCSQNKLRSPTAAAVFANWQGIETDSAGLYDSATVPLSSEQIEWADIIFVMEQTHRNRLQKKFSRLLKTKRVVCLNIPDDFEFMDPMLIRLLENRAGRYLR